VDFDCEYYCFPVSTVYAEILNTGKEAKILSGGREGALPPASQGTLLQFIIH